MYLDSKGASRILPSRAGTDETLDIVSVSWYSVVSISVSVSIRKNFKSQYQYQYQYERFSSLSISIINNITQVSEEVSGKIWEFYVVKVSVSVSVSWYPSGIISVSVSLRRTLKYQYRYQYHLEDIRSLIISISITNFQNIISVSSRTKNSGIVSPWVVFMCNSGNPEFYPKIPDFRIFFRFSGI